MSRLILGIFSVFGLMLFIPRLAYANGGDQRVVEKKYLINLSRAPFTPRVSIKTSFLASFLDIQAGTLIKEDIIVRLRIAKLGGSGSDKRTFIYEQDNIVVKGGVLESSYSFSDPGLHEIFFDFAFASNPDTIFEAPDFLIDVQPNQNEQPAGSIILVIGGVILGLLGSKLFNHFLNKR